MRSFTLISALLLCSWISVPVSETQAVGVQPGEEVTLLCSNISRAPTHTFWSRLDNKFKITCISSTYTSDDQASYCDGFKNGKYEMSYNITTIFLKIKQADVSDSGLYLCGFYMDRHTILTAVDLNVQGNDGSPGDIDCDVKCTKEPDAITKLTSVILGGLSIFLVMVIVGLAVKYRKVNTAHNEENSPQKQNLGSGDLNYAALSFQAKPKRSRRPRSERELEPNVVYAATR